jgi:hypothetical protein
MVSLLVRILEVRKALVNKADLFGDVIIAQQHAIVFAIRT